MKASSGSYPTFFDAVWDWDGSRRIARNLVLVIAGTMVLTLSARIAVPFYPVPMTMQTFVVLVLGMAYGWRLGVATMALYLVEGAFGLPVFAGTPERGLGLAYMLGPTGGYLLGFVIAAAVCGWLAERGWGRTMVSTCGAMAIGNALIYGPGLLWLGSVVGWDKPVLQWGLTPFLLGDLAKLALAVLLLPLAWRLVKRWKPER